MATVEFIFFVGPPYSGKTLHYHRFYSSSHVRVSASDFFRSKPTSGLREFIVRVVDYLVEGRSVVLDDENWSKATRNSYMVAIRKKIPSCKFKCVSFSPKFGVEQCYWSREWACARRTREKLESTNYVDSDMKIDQWINADPLSSHLDLTGPDLPYTSEGFDVVQVKSSLSCSSSKKFIYPGLLIQWEAIIDPIKGSLKANASHAIVQWNRANPCGRIILISDGKRPGPSANSIESLNPIATLSSQVRCPVYYFSVLAPTSYGRFSLPPHPGLIAWLQFNHSLALNHQSTFYVALSSYHKSSADAAGVKAIKASRVLDSVKSLLAIQIEMKSVPKLIEDIDFVAIAGEESSDKEIRPGKNLVLNETTFLWDQHDVSPAAIHGFVAKNEETLKTYIDACKYYAHTGSLAGSSYFSSSILPPESQSFSLSEDSGGMLTYDEIKRVAGDPDVYGRGVNYQSKVKTLNSSQDGDGTFISSQCEGSSSENYDISATLSCKNSVIEFCCSCPMGQRDVCCKHVIAVLRKHKQLQDDKVRREAGSSARLLPHWLSQSEEDGDAKRKRKRSEHVTAPAKKVARSRKKPPQKISYETDESQSQEEDLITSIVEEEKKEEEEDSDVTASPNSLPKSPSTFALVPDTPSPPLSPEFLRQKPASHKFLFASNDKRTHVAETLVPETVNESALSRDSTSTLVTSSPDAPTAPTASRVQAFFASPPDKRTFVAETLVSDTVTPSPTKDHGSNSLVRVPDSPTAAKTDANVEETAREYTFSVLDEFLS